MLNASKSGLWTGIFVATGLVEFGYRSLVSVLPLISWLIFNWILICAQDLDTEVIVATASTPDATAVSANVVVDERQMNALFLDLVSYFLFFLSVITR